MSILLHFTSGIPIIVWPQEPLFIHHEVKPVSLFLNLHSCNCIFLVSDIHKASVLSITFKAVFRFFRNLREHHYFIPPYLKSISVSSVSSVLLFFPPFPQTLCCLSALFLHHFTFDNARSGKKSSLLLVCVCLSYQFIMLLWSDCSSF